MESSYPSEAKVPIAIKGLELSAVHDFPQPVLDLKLALITQDKALKTGRWINHAELRIRTGFNRDAVLADCEWTFNK